MAARDLEPLHYAMVRLLADGRERGARDVVRELGRDYGGYRLLTLKDMEEALATAKENGILEEAGYDLDGGELVIRYRVSEFGRKMMERYLG